MMSAIRTLTALLFTLGASFSQGQGFSFEGDKYNGMTDSGAYYSIAIPDGWVAEDGLVIWNHGFEGYLEGWEAGDLLDILDPNWPGYFTGEVQENPGLGPWENIVLAQGYALAASSYSQTGWAVFNSHIANQELYQAFIEVAGLGSDEPDPLYLIGASLGGIVGTRDVETAALASTPDSLPEIDGALLACGAVGGAENWRNAFDARMVYEAICKDDGADELPQPWYTRPQFFTELELLDSLDQCVANTSRIVLERELKDLQGEIDATTNPGDLLALQLQWDILNGVWEDGNDDEWDRLKEIMALTNIPSAEFLTTQLWYAVFELPRLIEETGKLNGVIPFHNIGVDYGNPELNQLITRSIALPSSIAALNANYTPEGLIGNTKLLSIHNNLDGLVYVENQKTLTDNSNIPSNQLLTAVVEESYPTHCGFRESEGIAAWNTLQQWVESGTKPTVSDLQNGCEAISPYDPDIEREPDPDFNADLKCRFTENHEYRDTLASFPRKPEATVTGDNLFNGNTGLVTLRSVQLPGDGDLFDGELVPVGENTLGLPIFQITGAWPVGPAGGWQHSSYYDENQQLLYVPGLTTVNAPTYPDAYNVFMRRYGPAGNSLEVLEYEVDD